MRLFGNKVNKNIFEEDFDKNFFMLDNLENLIDFYKFKNDFKIIEDDLDEVRFIEDINNRRRLDAEVLSLVAANCENGKFLDIGTHLGRSAARMAYNSPNSKIYTVNISPEEYNLSGDLSTEALTKDKIGSFYKEKGISNIKQIYANTKTWEIPQEINNLSLVYIDGCHNKEFVFSDTKLIFDKIKPGGFILWHDFSPKYRENFHWINESMLGIEKLMKEKIIKGPILNVQNSWVGIWRKY